jgi:hypothetical protein
VTAMLSGQPKPAGERCAIATFGQINPAHDRQNPKAGL